MPLVGYFDSRNDEDLGSTVLFSPEVLAEEGDFGGGAFGRVLGEGGATEVDGIGLGEDWGGGEDGDSLLG